MDPEDRALLLRTAKLAEDNNRRLRHVQRFMFWSHVWGVIKVAIIVIPLVIGYFYLQPHLGSLGGNMEEMKALLQNLK